ncbi:ABC transporter permease [Clostridium fallax]|uniref:Peptide/nickel transport system permease protein n=1 Tax=Clostridium fallax TaxID=1533 RepID=A0A1M4T614_9CLOT|nr:ABC transporter permease [Clostridium fallax]SHE39952.1 peptide/nickel transport system permease protein [Clostridium fallax]SQB22616.1 oligopeptide ABC transporter permease [Clostridium fallax]
MIKIIFKRIKSLIPMLLFISIVSFMLLELAPGDPSDAYITPLMSFDDIENLKNNMGLNQSIFIRYFSWLKSVFTGNFGYSLINHMPVLPQILERLYNTLLLVGTSLILSVIISIPLGIFSSIKRNSLIDRLITVLNYVGLSLPSFWIGMMLIAIFSVKLKLLPSSGMNSIGNNSPIDFLKHLILPLLTLSLYNISVFTRYTRSSVYKELRKQYVTTAKSKGLSNKKIFFKHVLKNSLTPIVTILGMSIQRLVTGAFVTEVIFSWPGMGRLMIDSIFSRDYPIIMAITLFSSLFLIIGNLISDTLYIILNPKINVNSKGGF